MPETALVFSSSQGKTPGGLPGEILGLSFLERAVHTAVQSGARRVLILRRGKGGSEAALTAWRRGEKVQQIAPLVMHALDEESWRPAVQALTGQVLVVDERTLFSPALVAGAARAGVGRKECAVFRRADNQATGLGICPGNRVEKIIRHWRVSDTSHLWDEKLDDAVAVPAAGGFTVAALSAASYEEGRRSLLSAVRKDTDGFVSRHLNRPISLQLSRLFIRLGVTPNQISVGNLILGVVGALAAAAGTSTSILWGGVLFQASSVIDGSDGEVAKLTFNASEKGSWIDTLCDELTMLAFFTALPVGMYRRTGHPVYLGLIFLTLLAAGCLYLLMIRYVRLKGSHGSMVQILDDFRREAATPGLLGRVTAVVSTLDFVVRRDFFTFLIFILCAFDLAAAVVWTLALFITAAAVFFAAFSRRAAAGSV